MRQLKMPVWVWVLEIQQKSGEGWPHWHVLADASHYGGRLPLNVLRKLWLTWRDKWEVGRVDVQARPFASAVHAVRYITKYLMKSPEKGYPNWVLLSDRRIRLVAGSKAVGALVADAADESRKASGDESDEDREPMKPLAVRMSECGRSCTMFAEFTDTDTGEVRLRHIGRLPVPFEIIAGLAERGELGYSSSMGIAEDGRAYGRKWWRECACDDEAALMAALGADMPCLVRFWQGPERRAWLEELLAKAERAFPRADRELEPWESGPGRWVAGDGKMVGDEVGKWFAIGKNRWESVGAI
jgi:hypothetical protein